MIYASKISPRWLAGHLFRSCVWSTRKVGSESRLLRNGRWDRKEKEGRLGPFNKSGGVRFTRRSSI